MRLERVDKAAKALDAARDETGCGGDHQKALVALLDTCLDRAIRGLVVIGLDPVGVEVVELGIDEDEGFAAVADRFADLTEARGRLHDKAVHAERDQAVDIGELALLVEVRGTDEHAVASRPGDRVDTLDQLICERVGDISDDHADHLGVLGVHSAGEGARLVAGVVDGLADARLGIVAHAVGLAVEVERDRRLGRAGHGRDLLDRDALLCIVLAGHSSASFRWGVDSLICKSVYHSRFPTTNALRGWGMSR